MEDGINLSQGAGKCQTGWQTEVWRKSVGPIGVAEDNTSGYSTIYPRLFDNLGHMRWVNTLLRTEAHLRGCARAPCRHRPGCDVFDGDAAVVIWVCGAEGPYWMAVALGLARASTRSASLRATFGSARSTASCMSAVWPSPVLSSAVDRSVTCFHHAAKAYWAWGLVAR